MGIFMVFTNKDFSGFKQFVAPINHARFGYGTGSRFLPDGRYILDGLIDNGCSGAFTKAGPGVDECENVTVGGKNIITKLKDLHCLTRLISDANKRHKLSGFTFSLHFEVCQTQNIF